MQERIQYRVAVIDPKTRKILTAKATGVDSLLTVSIPVGGRVVRELQKAVFLEWELRVLILELLSSDESAPYAAVAELLEPTMLAGLKALGLRELSPTDLNEQQRFRLQQILEDNACHALSSLEWIDKAVDWIKDITGSGDWSKRTVLQYNAGDGCMLLEVRSATGQVVWMKATGASQKHEYAITSHLCQLSPDHLPTLIALQPLWNAWIMVGNAPRTQNAECCVEPSQQIEQAVVAMAKLQTRTTDHVVNLLGAGAVDQRVSVWQEHGAALFEYIKEAAGLQVECGVRRISASRVKELHEIFERSNDHLARLKVPDAILHGDMHLDNLIAEDNNCKFIDWCEAYVGNPLITFQHLLLLDRPDDANLKPRRRDSLLTSYREVWSTHCDPAVMTDAFPLTSLLAAVSTLYGRGEWLTSPERLNPRRQRYARNLARYMDTAANSPELLQALGA